MLCLEFCLQISGVKSVKSVRIWRFFGSHIPKYGQIFGISQYSVQMRENVDQKNSEYGHFSRIAALLCISDVRNVYECLYIAI